MASYDGKTTTELKAVLQSRGAKTSGRKADLIERLEAYDRNRNFANEAIILPREILPEWPSDVTGFKQMCSEHRDLLPKISVDHIKGYFKFRLASDKEMSGDFKGMEKAKLMLESDRIDACSILLADYLYLTGIVRAAMKKKVSYSYKIKIKLNGEVLNSDCECPAGKGPHSTCKHVATVLLMLVKFVEEGNLLVGKTCTETLQSFHKPTKVHEGSPIKAANLPCNKKPNLDDPRPAYYRNQPGYQDHVRNTVINFCSNTGTDIPLRYVYSRANLQDAVHDHSYLEKPFTEYWVLDSLKVSMEEATNIESKTRAQSQSLLWFDVRQWRITASRFGEILKMTERRNIENLCKSITSLISNFDTEATVHGRQFENSAIKEFEKLRNLKVLPCGFFIRPDIPFLGATPDGIIDSKYIVEVKCPYKGRDVHKINATDGNFPFLETSNDGALHLKRSHNYFIQIQGQLHITNRTICYFIVYVFNDIFVEEIMYDEAFCTQELIPKLHEFFNKDLLKYIAKNL